MTTRELPRDEYARLVGTELETVAPLLPESARVLVVEDGDQIVGCWTFFSVLHAEGLWIADSHRKRGSVARHLWCGMRQMVAQMGAKGVNTAAVSDDVKALLEKVGAIELPGTHYVMQIERGPCQPL